MALRDQIESVRDGALASLNNAHDYYTYTKDAWRVIQQAVLIDGMRLFLASSTLQQFVTIFENFLSDAARAWLPAYADRLSRRQLSGKELLALPDKAAIIDALVEKELRDVFYDRPANWFEYLKTMVNITAPGGAEGEQFAEIKATRDVLVHGQGIANAYYMDKAGKSARSQLGQPLGISQSYHQQSWEVVCKLVRDIGTEMAAKA